MKKQRFLITKNSPYLYRTDQWACYKIIDYGIGIQRRFVYIGIIIEPK